MRNPRPMRDAASRLTDKEYRFIRKEFGITKKEAHREEITLHKAAKDFSPAVVVIRSFCPKSYPQPQCPKKADPFCFQRGSACFLRGYLTAPLFCAVCAISAIIRHRVRRLKHRTYRFYRTPFPESDTSHFPPDVPHSGCRSVRTALWFWR